MKSMVKNKSNKDLTQKSPLKRSFNLDLDINIVTSCVTSSISLDSVSVPRFTEVESVESVVVLILERHGATAHSLVNK